jgi:hypothetical protein
VHQASLTALAVAPDLGDDEDVAAQIQAMPLGGPSRAIIARSPRSAVGQQAQTDPGDAARAGWQTCGWP